MRYSRTSLLLVAMTLVAAGCGPDQAAKENLSAGFNAFQNPSPDDEYADALSRADAQLAKDPQGPGSADALYLRGRALEQRIKHTDAQGHEDFVAARQAYVDALNRQPSPQLAQYIHISLGNVCYWLDDYAAALQEWSQIAGKSNDDGLNAFAMYRIGLCEQRLGNFAGADQTFNQVAQKYPGTEAALRSQQHVGYKFFVVQLATYADRKLADANMRGLQREGANPQDRVEGAKYFVTVGPANTYVQAQQIRLRYIPRYPDAVILP